MRSALIAVALLLLPIAVRAQVQEEIFVERIIVDARVMDRNAEPLLGLTTNDFRVTIDGKPAEVEAVDWVVDSPAAQRAHPELAPPAADGVRGRNFVFFFQTDFGRAAVRVHGQMEFLSWADEFLSMLEPEDRVAVVQFDSHLKLRLDFTTDRAALLAAMRDTLKIDDPPPPPPADAPALAPLLDRQELANVTSVDHAFQLLAKALYQIDGAKTMLVFGYGFGTLTGAKVGAPEVILPPDYGVTRGMLATARVTVFSMNAMHGNQLATALKLLASDTGGFYAVPRRFADVQGQLARALVGHYELEVRKPSTPTDGGHTINVQVKQKRAFAVMARKTYVDQP